MLSKLAADTVRVAPTRPARGGFTRLLVKFEEMMRAYRERRALLALSDHMLADLGLTRADAYREGTRPFWNLPER
jgi:uncharacterized protein YjiS (DUF1127 family)